MLGNHEKDYYEPFDGFCVQNTPMRDHATLDIILFMSQSSCTALHGITLGRRRRVGVQYYVVAADPEAVVVDAVDAVAAVDLKAVSKLRPRLWFWLAFFLFV